MDSSMYTQWLQASQIPEEPRASVADDWSKDRLPQQTMPPQSQSSVPPSSIASPTMDMSDFTTLADLGGPTNASILSASPQSFYSQYVTPGYFLQSPYTTMAYGTPWPAPAPVPLSNYSSLNGATTSSSTSQPQPQQQQQAQQSQQQQPQQHQQQPQQSHPSTSNHMVIDPILSMNGSSSSTMQSSFSQSPTYPSQPSQQQQQQHQQQQQSHQAQSQLHLQQRPQYFNQQLIYPPYYRQQSQPTPQGTLSPQALHSPTSSMMAVIPSSFYAQPALSQPQPQQSVTLPVASTSQQPSSQAEAPAPGPTAEERKRQFQNAIQPLLQSSAFTGAQAVHQLTERIAEYGASEVDAATRLEILARIRDGAGNHYYRAWSENATAIDITREWIKAAAKGNNAPLVETTMPLLHLIDRLPFTVESLTSSKLGKIIKKLVKDEPSSAIKDMASNLERRWRNMISGVEGSAKAPENKGTEDLKTKKRKLNEPAAPKAPQPLKKAAVGTASSMKPVIVKKEVKPLAAAVKDAKADYSFFSAPKPKAKLPSFKKAPVAVQVKKEDGNVAMPSSFDPFQEALKSMKARKESPAAPTPPPTATTSSTSSSESQPGLDRNGRRKKNVTWAADGALESVKLIEKAIYDDDPVDGIHVAHSLRDLDRGEGAALHAHLFEETSDWSEPLLVELPPEDEAHPRVVRGSSSTEKVTQEEREQTALGAVYMSPNQIPDSPAEPTNLIPEEEVDKEVKTMSVGPEVDALFEWSAGEPSGGATTGSSVADLVGQLAMGSSVMDTSMTGVPPNTTPSALDLQGASATLAAVQNFLPQEQLQQLLQQLSAGQAAQYGQYSAGGGDGTSWGSSASTPNHFTTDSFGAGGYHEDSQADTNVDGRLKGLEGAADAAAAVDGGGATKEAIDRTLKENLAVSLQQEDANTEINVTLLMTWPQSTEAVRGNRKKEWPLGENAKIHALYTIFSHIIVSSSREGLIVIIYIINWLLST
ncbi:hypothetical protein BDZ97DRAFT_682188 [Flammula alnicola]|nr:hypothetical protein BDZ97DRAFT_682188 [Flammula alnicola]